VDFVDDVYLTAVLAGRISNALLKFPHLADAGVGGAVDFQYVEVIAPDDRLARRAFVARVTVFGETLAIDNAGKDSSRAGFSTSSRTGEQVGV
jgi:hypothetical protein